MREATEIIARYDLVPHPEGGHYREVHRSTRSVGVPPGHTSERVASTTILYLLPRGEFSALHRIRGEEVWIHLAGAPLELVVWADKPTIHTLAAVESGGHPFAVVPPGAYQGARSTGDWTLVSCLVAPGFEFADLEIPQRADLLDRYPDQTALVDAFTR